MCIRIQTSQVVLPDLENMGITVGNLSLSCIQVVVYVCFVPYALPVHGRHRYVPLTLTSALTQTSSTVLSTSSDIFYFLALRPVNV